jgi:signal transduction histidine kinase
MKEHNGAIEAANAPGGGAVFTVTLPAASGMS